MTILYLDCQAGISGDMAVGALLDLGVPLEFLQTELARLGLPDNSYALSISRTERQHIAALKFDVSVHDHHTHRRYADIDAMIVASGLSACAKQHARAIFRRLAEAEAAVHGVPVEDVHFHEVGALDSIIDIVGVAICLDYLEVGQVFASPLPLGSGFVESAHGCLPVPAPATAKLLAGLPLHGRCGAGERVTPTGAAIVATLATDGGTLPPVTFSSVGHGAGSRDFEDMPNLLRAFLATNLPKASVDVVVEASCNLDDVTPEVIAYTQELLLERGALDAWLTPIQMKKGRPGVMLSFLCAPENLKPLSDVVMAETGTLGVRHREMERLRQSRHMEDRDTCFGRVRFKVSARGEKPEYEDCRRIARERNVPCRQVMRQLQAGEDP